MQKIINLCKNNDFMPKWYISTWEFLKTYGINRIRLQHALVRSGCTFIPTTKLVWTIFIFLSFENVLKKIITPKNIGALQYHVHANMIKELSDQRVNPFYVVNCNQLSRNFFVLVIWEEFKTFEFLFG